MSLEALNTVATFATFFVIAATAVAAIVQLRHMRGSNQIAALKELQETIESEDFASAEQGVFVELPAKARDPEFRYECRFSEKRTGETRALVLKISKVGNFYENMGLLVKTGLADKNLVLETWSDIIVHSWEKLVPFTVIRRRTVGDGLWENFEYLTVLSQDWLAAHPKGAYPGGVRRIDLKDEWLEADGRYAASLAPA